MFNQFVYEPIHTLGEAWVTNPFGEQVDNVINQLYSPFFGGQELIGNGANGSRAPQRWPAVPRC